MALNEDINISGNLKMPVEWKLYSVAFVLAIITIVYNLGEGLVSTFFGLEDKSFALFGFGVDSFIEVISGVGIAHMITRIRLNPKSDRDSFEQSALKITGTAFYVLVAGLLATSFYNLWYQNNPETTRWGIIISLISILTMWLLIRGKLHVGGKLNSNAIIADARCTRVCLIMSVILLVSSGIYEIFQLSYVDSIGAMGLAFFSFREGRECFEKAKSGDHCNCEDH